MPFRSESESLREQLRRVEAQAQELLDERAALESQLAEQKERARGGSRRWMLLVAAIIAVGAVALLGFTYGDGSATKRELHVRELRERQQSEELYDLRDQISDCKRNDEERRSDLDACELEKTTVRRQLRRPLVPRGAR